MRPKPEPKPKRITLHDILLKERGQDLHDRMLKKESALYKSLKILTKLGHKRFDAVFRTEVQSIRPDWFDPL